MIYTAHSPLYASDFHLFGINSQQGRLHAFLGLPTVFHLYRLVISHSLFHSYGNFRDALLHHVGVPRYFEMDLQVVLSQRCFRNIYRSIDVLSIYLGDHRPVTRELNIQFGGTDTGNCHVLILQDIAVGDGDRYRLIFLGHIRVLLSHHVGP